MSATHTNIAIFNATRKTLKEIDVSDSMYLEYYFDSPEGVYVLDEYAFVDAEVLADYTHEDFVNDGWIRL